eukprot:1161840-Pelagomonas_calceolata.AAC.13
MCRGPVTTSRAFVRFAGQSQPANDAQVRAQAEERAGNAEAELAAVRQQLCCVPSRAVPTQRRDSGQSTSRSPTSDSAGPHAACMTCSCKPK